MQRAGKLCSFCSEPIILDSEGTVCAACGTIAHEACIGENGSACPNCHHPWSDNRKLERFANACPSCGTQNSDPPRKSCHRCGAILVFDTRRQFQEERLRVHRLGVRQLVSGLLLLTLSVGLFAAALHCVGYAPGDITDKPGLLRAKLAVIPYVIFAIMALLKGLTLVARSRPALRFG